MSIIKIDMERSEVTKDGQTLCFDFEKLPGVRVLVWYAAEQRGKIETLTGFNTTFDDVTQFQYILDTFEAKLKKPMPEPVPIETLPVRFFDVERLAEVVEQLAKQAGLADEEGKVKKAHVKVEVPPIQQQTNAG